jgi:acetylornithine deacetylase/succinyl-diaminopimelate desuccinylase-like protein
VIPEDHPACQALVAAHRGMYGEPRVDKWTFSTNGVSIMGRYGIPCIGFGPGAEAQAHAPNEITWKSDLVFEKESFELLQDILDMAGELSKRAPYEDLVNTEYALKSAK